MLVPFFRLFILFSVYCFVSGVIISCLGHGIRIILSVGSIGQWSDVVCELQYRCYISSALQYILIMPTKYQLYEDLFLISMLHQGCAIEVS